jgi:putative FmdB family regulatory protein
MPIFDIHCRSCGYQGEVLVLSSKDPLTCPGCGGHQPEKQISPTSTLTGSTRHQIPGPRDHGCCGSRPAEAGCAGPGSCCAGNLTRK